MAIHQNLWAFTEIDEGQVNMVKESLEASVVKLPTLNHDTPWQKVERGVNLDFMGKICIKDNAANVRPKGRICHKIRPLVSNGQV